MQNKGTVAMEFGILGPLQATTDGQSVDLGSPRQRALLAFLVVNVGRLVTLDELVEALWRERRTGNPVHTIHVYVSNLRRALEPGRAAGDPGRLLCRDQGGYRLAGEHCRVDAVDFEGAIRRASDVADPALRRALLAEALGWWRGRALTDIHEPFAELEAHRLDQLRLDAQQARIAADLELGVGSELASELEGLVDEHPLRERLWLQLAVALYRSGRQAEALRRLAALRACLADELGLEPTPAVGALERAILNHDPSLMSTVGGPSRPIAITAGGIHRDEAGAPDVDPPGPPSPLRLATVVVCEVIEPPDWTERLPPAEVDVWRTALSERMATVARRYGGRRLQAREPTPWSSAWVWSAHEDDPERAVRAALEMADQPDLMFGVGGAGWSPGAPTVRLGVATGRLAAPAPPDSEDAPGGSVRWRERSADRTATELCRAAEPGVVLVAASTSSRVEDLFRLGDSFEFVSAPDEPSIPAAAVLAPVPGARRHRRPGSSTAPLVGREAEYRRAVEALAGLRAGRGGILLLSGDPGSGKTRLLDELRRTFEAQGDGLWLEGAGRSGGGAEPYHPLREVLLHWLGLEADATDLRLRSSLGRQGRRLAGTQWAALEPTLTVLLGLAESAALEPGGLPPASNAFAPQAAAVLANLLRAMAADRPVVVALDDLQWADPSSLQLIERLLDPLQGAAVLIVIALRSPADPAGWTLPEQVRRQLRNRITEVELGPLPPGDVSCLLDHLVGPSTLPAALHAELRTVAAGNPFFLQELVRHLEANGTLQPSPAGPQLRGPASIPLPPTIEQVILGRIGDLSAIENDLLDASALIGPRIERRMLELLVGRRPDMERALEELCRRALLLEVERWPEPVYQFAHALVAQAVLGMLSAAERSDLHRLAAAALLEVHSGSALSLVAGELAKHYEAAGQPDVAVEWYERALARAEAGRAAPEAEALVVAALSLADREQIPLEPERLLRLLLARTRLMFWRTWDHAACWPTMQRSLELLPLVESASLVEEAALLSSMVSMAEDLVVATDYLRSCVVEPSGAHRATMRIIHRARLAIVLANRLDLDGADAAARESLDQALADGGSRHQIRALDGLKLVLVYRGRQEEAAQVIDEILALPDDSPGTLFHLHARAELALGALSDGCWERAAAALADALQSVELNNFAGFSVAAIGNWMIQALVGAGRLDEAFSEADRLVRTANDGRTLAVALLARGRVLAELGAGPVALGDLDGSVDLASKGSFNSIALPAACRAALVAAELGRADGGRLERAQRMAGEAPGYFLEADAYLDLAEALLAVGDRQGALALAARVRDEPMGPPAWATERAATLACRASTGKEAEGAFPDPWNQAHAGHRWRAWAARAALIGRPGDRQQARAEIERLARAVPSEHQPAFLLDAMARLSS